MKTLIWTMALLLVASCGRVLPGGDANDAVDVMLTAIEPSIANTNDVITLEGTFGDTVTVQFPGGTSQAATVLGAHRATVTVPITATEGDLTAITGGATIGPLPFRRASFAMGLGAFEANLEQPEGARQGATLVTPRTSHTSVVVGNYLYILGGVSKGTPLTTVERAMIHADGSLGPFATVPGVTLTTARYAYTSAVIGSYLYVVGGFDNIRALNSVERATIKADGSLGSFAIVPGVTLVAARQGHTSTVVGNYLYVLGGNGSNGYLNTVERAMIHTDGSLDPFVTVSGVTLATARSGHTSEVIGGYLYVVGGFDSSNALSSIEQTTISADGSLGSFVTVSGVTLATARNNQTSMVLGTHLYVVGGVGPTGTLSSVEQANIHADGSLGAFTIVSGAILPTVSNGHTSAVIGNFLYVLGGLNNSSLNGTARATINADGALGMFATVPGVTLVTARNGHTSAVIRNYLYVVGGVGNVALNSVERATINADGSLGPFATVPGVTLVTARSYHTSAVVGNYLYIVGGSMGGVERATINADGSLDTFETVPNVTLATPRSVHSSVVVGNYLYIFGGYTSVYLNSIERAAINADSSLGPFATVSGITLATARCYHTSAVVGRYLYMVGGASGTGYLNSIERAMINIDGSLGPFATVQGVTLMTARFAHGSAVVGSYLYVLGGPDSGVERAMINADGSLGPFAAVSGVTLTIGRSFSASAVVGNYLYLVGGLANNVAVNSVERATLSANVP